MARLLIPSFLFLTILCLAVSVTARPSTHNDRAAHTQQASPPIKIHHRRGAKATGQQNLLRTFPVAATDPNYGGKAGSSTANVPLTYHGGMVMTKGVNVYLIWYGNWNQPTASASSMQILRNFIASLGPNNTLTPGIKSVRGWYNTMLPYFQTNPQAYVSPNIGLAGEYVDKYSKGYRTVITDGIVQKIVNNAFNHLPTDLNGIYFVLPSPDVNVLNFCDSKPKWCGYHSTLPYNTAPGYKYSLVPNSAGKCGGTCGDRTDWSPNGDIGMDAMVSIFAHELTETISDEDGSAWYDSQGYENADKCAYNYGPNSTTSSGALYNLVGAQGQPFLVQQQWSIQTQQCVQQGPSPPPTGTKPPPAPPAIPPPANPPLAPTPTPPASAPACVGNGSCINIFQSDNYVKYIGSVQGSPGQGSICWNVQAPVIFSSMQIVWNEPKGNPNGVGCNAVTIWDHGNCWGKGVYWTKPSWSGTYGQTNINSFKDTTGASWTANVKSFSCVSSV